jgi:hypothetical protein
VLVVDGAPIERVGRTLSTLHVALGPAANAVLPTVSDAVAAAMEMPSVPFPVMPEIVTVRVAVPEPETPTVPVTPPVVLSVTLAFASVTVFAPL